MAALTVMTQADFRDPKCFTALVTGTNTAENTQTDREETLAGSCAPDKSSSSKARTEHAPKSNINVPKAEKLH